MTTLPLLVAWLLLLVAATTLCTGAWWLARRAGAARLLVALALVLGAFIGSTATLYAAPVPTHVRPECVDEHRAMLRAGVQAPYVSRGLWIAWRESRCDTRAINRRTFDYGSWQFHASLWLPKLCDAGIVCSRAGLLDVNRSARAYRWLTDRRGTRDWCYSGRCPWGRG